MGFSHHTISCPMLRALLVIICSCFLRFTAAIDTIRVNQSIRDPETLISYGQKFKFGFFSPVNSSYRYVGVMFNVPVITAIWVANREKPLNDSTGTVEISGDGNLVIMDGQKEIIWSSNILSYVKDSSAVILDTGNLVLQDNSNGRTIWQSFEHASDSFVEKMKISTDLRTNEKNILTSWRSPQDPGLGNFTSTVEPLVIPQSFVWKNGYPYWRSGPWNGQIFIGMPYMKSFYKHGMDVVNDHLGSAYLIFANLNSSVFLYYVLNSSGNLVEKLWSDEKGAWLVTWSSIVNECDIYGRCGPFACCNAQDEPICTCFPGYEPINKDEWSAENWTSGCTRITPLRCERNNSAGKEDGFLKLSQVKVPDHVKWLPAPDVDCRRQCLSNCSCIAYAYYAGIGCMTWAESLIDVQKLSDGGPDLYIRLAHSELGDKKYWKVITAAIVVLAFITILLCAHFLRKLFSQDQRKRKTELIQSATGKTDAEYSEVGIAKHNMHGVKLEALPLFKLGTLSHATRKFDSMNKLGQGGFGPVYKGKLPNGQEIAVKRMARSSNQGVEEFMNEVEVISKLQHRNLVRLLGCCVEHAEKMLVYEYMPNGSLDSYLFDSCKQQLLDWQTRLAIIEGICRGLLYLHRDSRLRIIHRDLKASNILLDEELNPKISDFGMARIFCCKEDQANTTRVVGTYGYMPPEYALRGIFSEKSDVYSFGVLLLEILSGKRNTSFYHEDQQLFLIAYAWKLWNENKIMNLIDPIIYDPRVESDVVRYANVGLLCIQEIAADRPHISAVLSMLSSESVVLPRPKQPPFSAIQMSPETEYSQMTPDLCSVKDVAVTIVGR
ncbi:G-type lectin S-receptor-like serine/threonine-protein kinase [Sesamum alatum]|uniref:Receptor-like serine/threonine-protein kinase n=1 Tax=Sesamum alatum TaxID=300844 RepID=A0AAE1Y039_9LAMI|nr:G-type lectin S-receptor-like serine/threonine-protein kinase [Sesamum alatum]